MAILRCAYVSAVRSAFLDAVESREAVPRLLECVAGGADAVNVGRDVPEPVRRILRREVGFGCPVQGCGSPYLGYHHFDPPWRLEKHHRPEGMIALCAEHHKHADYGAFTIEQLRAMKLNPFLIAEGIPIKGGFAWKRRELAVAAGSNLVVGCPILLRVDMRRIVWISTDEQGFGGLNVDLLDQNGHPAVQMRHNDWVVLSEPADICCPPKGNSLSVSIPTKGISLSVEFFEVNACLQKEFQTSFGTSHSHAVQADDRPSQACGIPKKALEPRMAARAAEVARELETESMAVCMVEACLVYPRKVAISKDLAAFPGGNSICGCTIIGCDVAVDLRPTGLRIAASDR